MAENDRGAAPLNGGLPLPTPDETGHRRKPNRLVISGGPLGPQLMMLPTLDLYPEEEDPNP